MRPTPTAMVLAYTQGIRPYALCVSVASGSKLSASTKVQPSMYSHDNSFLKASGSSFVVSGPVSIGTYEDPAYGRLACSGTRLGLAACVRIRQYARVERRASAPLRDACMHGGPANLTWLVGSGLFPTMSMNLWAEINRCCKLKTPFPLSCSLSAIVQASTFASGR